jgi:uncharacterized protein YkwD
MFNFIDLLIGLVLIYFIWQGLETGFFGGLLNFISTVISLFVSLLYYPALGDFFANYLRLGQNLSQLVSFFGLLILTGFLGGYFLSFLYKLFSKLFLSLTPLRFFDRMLGVFPSLVIGLFLVVVFTLLPLILPFGLGIRKPVEASWWGKNVLSQTHTMEPALERFIHQLPTKNLAHLFNPKPISGETVALNFPPSLQLSVNEEIERGMLTLVNEERAKEGLAPLEWDPGLTEVARKHSRDMFERGYFSHYNPDNLSPFDRMLEGGVTFEVAGENLAYAPTLEVAHQGLMNSPGHRENILRSEFGRLGIGVIDGGSSGIMFTQNFAN